MVNGKIQTKFTNKLKMELEMDLYRYYYSFGYQQILNHDSKHRNFLSVDLLELRRNNGKLLLCNIGKSLDQITTT